MSETVRVVIAEPACGDLVFKVPNEELALMFFEWAQQHGFKVSMAHPLDVALLNSMQGQALVDAITAQFADDMGAGRDDDDDDLQG